MSPKAFKTRAASVMLMLILVLFLAQGGQGMGWASAAAHGPPAMDQGTQAWRLVVPPSVSSSATHVDIAVEAPAPVAGGAPPEFEVRFFVNGFLQSPASMPKPTYNADTGLWELSIPVNLPIPSGTVLRIQIDPDDSFDVPPFSKDVVVT